MTKRLVCLIAYAGAHKNGSTISYDLGLLEKAFGIEEAIVFKTECLKRFKKVDTLNVALPITMTNHAFEVFYTLFLPRTQF